MMPRKSQRGLTLLETLVTLVIVAIVAGLMSEGMYQLSRIEQRLGTGQMQAQLGRLHVLWVQQALEGLQAEAPESPDRFKGGDRQMQGLSGQLPVPERQGPLPLRLSLKYRSGLGSTELSLDAAFDGKDAKPVVLARWPGDAGSFTYLDEKGQWLRDWPPARLDAPQLPRAIAIRQQGEGLLLLAAPQATATALGRRIDLRKLP